MKEPEAEWKRELRGYELILRAETEQEPYAAKMLRYNRLPSMPAVSVGWIDGKEEFCYDISGLTTVSEYLREEKPTGDMIRGWMTDLLDLFGEAENYLLPEENFVCRPEYLFLTPKQEIRACYLEGYGEPIDGQLREFVGSFLEKIRYEEEDDVQLVYDLYQCCTENCSERKLREILARKPEKTEARAEPAQEKEASEQETEAEPVSAEPVTDKKAYLIFGAGVLAAGIMLFLGGQFFTESGEFRWLRTSAFLVLCAAAAGIVFREDIVRTIRRRREEAEFDWGWTEQEEDLSATQPIPGLSEMIAEAEDETKERTKAPKLMLEAEDGEDTEIYVLPCVIGSMYASDFVIRERTVSRSHAQIEEENGRICLEDLASLNGTWLNGTRLREARKAELREGDVIKIAETRFIVHLPAEHR